MGAVLDQLRYAAGVIGREINAVSDNPLVFADTDEIVSGGNFHAEPVALAADAIAVAIAEIGALAERRIALLTDQHMGGLPPFLVADPGLNSGFMIAQVTAAALTSENRALAAPHSVDSISTSGNQEDYVSMGMGGARRLERMLRNLECILAIELLSACQGIDLLVPLKTGILAGEAYRAVRARSPKVTEDRSTAADIQAVSALIGAGVFSKLLR